MRVKWLWGIARSGTELTASMRADSDTASVRQMCFRDSAFHVEALGCSLTASEMTYRRQRSGQMPINAAPSMSSQLHGSGIGSVRIAR